MKAKITLPNIKGYLQAHYRQALDEMGFLEDHIKQQALYRLWLISQKSPECYKSNKCVHCNCEISSKIFEDRGCSKDLCYGELLSKDSWDKYMKESPMFAKFIKTEWNKFKNHV